MIAVDSLLLGGCRRKPLIHLCGDALPTARTLSPYRLQRFSKVLAAQALLLALGKLADGEVHLLLAGTWPAEGHTQDLHLRATGARALRRTVHLAGSRLRRRLAQSNPLPESS